MSSISEILDEIHEEFNERSLHNTAPINEIWDDEDFIIAALRYYQKNITNLFGHHPRIPRAFSTITAKALLRGALLGKETISPMPPHEIAKIVSVKYEYANIVLSLSNSTMLTIKYDEPIFIRDGGVK